MARLVASADAREHGEPERASPAVPAQCSEARGVKPGAALQTALRRACLDRLDELAGTLSPDTSLPADVVQASLGLIASPHEIGVRHHTVGSLLSALEQADPETISIEECQGLFSNSVAHARLMAGLRALDQAAEDTDRGEARIVRIGPDD